MVSGALLAQPTHLHNGLSRFLHNCAVRSLVLEQPLDQAIEKAAECGPGDRLRIGVLKGYRLRMARRRPSVIVRLARSGLKLLLGIAVAWALGFVGFVLALPGPAGRVRTDGVAVLTGGPGRTHRGVAVLEAGLAGRMLVSGVDRSVSSRQFRIANGIAPDLFACCIDLGYVADSTRANATEVASWVRRHRFASIRLVTTGYHMPRARAEIRARVGPDVLIVPDAVAGERTLGQMAYEYSKFLVARFILLAYPVAR